MARERERASTEIARGTVVRGKVYAQEDLQVLGRIEGNVRLEGDLVVPSGGVVKADISAHRVVVAGVLLGNVTASEEIVVQNGGKVRGDLRAPRLAMAAGARVSGGLDIGDVDAPREARRRPAPAVEVPRPKPLPVPELADELDSDGLPTMFERRAAKEGEGGGVGRFAPAHPIPEVRADPIEVKSQVPSTTSARPSTTPSNVSSTPASARRKKVVIRKKR